MKRTRIRKKRKKMTKKKNYENDENDENVEKINASFIVKKLFDQKDHKIIDFTKRVNDLKKNYVDVSNI